MTDGEVQEKLDSLSEDISDVVNLEAKINSLEQDLARIEDSMNELEEKIDDMNDKLFLKKLKELCLKGSSDMSITRGDLFYLLGELE